MFNFLLILLNISINNVKYIYINFFFWIKDSEGVKNKES